MARRRAEPEPVTYKLPKGHLSPTQVEMYMRCATQYEFRYVKGIIAPPGIALLQGGAGHKALELNNRHKLEHGEDLPMTQVVEAFNDSFTDKVKAEKDIGWGSLDDKAARAEVVAPLKAYMKHMAPQYQPLAVEEKHEIKIGGVPVVLIIDLVDDHGMGIECADDYKVVSSRSPRREADALASFALGTYAWARNAQRVQFINLIKGGGATATPAVVVTAKRLVSVERRYQSIAAEITRGSFPPCDPTGWQCSERWCGYYGQCPFAS